MIDLQGGVVEGEPLAHPRPAPRPHPRASPPARRQPAPGPLPGPSTRPCSPRHRNDRSYVPPYRPAGGSAGPRSSRSALSDFAGRGPAVIMAGMHKTAGLRDSAAAFPLPATRDDVQERREVNRAIAVSAIGLAATGIAELLLAILTGSVGLLGDAIHNLSDVSTSAVAFLGSACRGEGRLSGIPTAWTGPRIWPGSGLRWSSGPARRSPGTRASVSSWRMAPPVMPRWASSARPWASSGIRSSPGTSSS
jgi:hypothetical protein